MRLTAAVEENRPQVNGILLNYAGSAPLRWLKATIIFFLANAEKRSEISGAPIFIHQAPF